MEVSNGYCYKPVAVGRADSFKLMMPPRVN